MQKMLKNRNEHPAKTATHTWHFLKWRHFLWINYLNIVSKNISMVMSYRYLQQLFSTKFLKSASQIIIINHSANTSTKTFYNPVNEIHTFIHDLTMNQLSMEKTGLCLFNLDSYVNVGNEHVWNLSPTI